ncbi:MAG: hypothetical protein HLX50_03150 [Alteromonadaceae bacterium]|nr:hypothetical protein [Alteromonadaceae bacterium]
MPISVTEFLKKYGFEEEEEEEEERDHSLRHNAMEHAKHLKRPHAGTPHDWEEWEKYKREHPGEVEDDSV